MRRWDTQQPDPTRRTDRLGEFDAGQVTGQHAGQQPLVAVQ